MSITFKQADLSQKEEILNLFKITAERIHRMNIDHWQYWKNPPPEKLQWVEEGIKNKEYFFIYEATNFIGMVRILNEDELYWGVQDVKAKYVHSLVVKSEFNGKGYGRKILNSIEQMAKDEGCKFLRLDCDSKNLNLCQYYESLEFTKVGVKEMTISTNNLYERVIS